MNNQQQPYDPFAEYINDSLDLASLDELDQVAIASKVRHVLSGLPANVTSRLWDEQLDDLQSVIRVCLDLDTVMSAFTEHANSTTYTRDDLETLIMLSVTFAFISYNQLRPLYGTVEAQEGENLLMALRLRDTLQVTFGWIKRAAHEGDPVASKLVEEIFTLLNAAKKLDEQ